MTHNPVICAIDIKDLEHAVKLAADLKAYVGAVKLGLEFFTAQGVEGVQRVADTGVPIFLDLKFHDIPNTVAGAMQSISTLPGVFMTTIHSSGGQEMMQAAKRAAGDIKVIGVTVLTSLDQQNLEGIGIENTPQEQVMRLAKLASDSDLDGCVCSPHEVAVLRKELGNDFTLVVPGIRLAGADAQDQKRTMTPKEALNAGADYLVIGRPITQANDSVQAAQQILEELGM